MTLPFLTLGTLQEGNGTFVRSVALSIWPAIGNVTDVGRAYDHEGQADIRAYSDLIVPNRILTVDGVKYRVISATKHTYVPHVALRLREMRPGGGG